VSDTKHYDRNIDMYTSNTGETLTIRMWCKERVELTVCYIKHRTMSIFGDVEARSSHS